MNQNKIIQISLNKCTLERRTRQTIHGFGCISSEIFCTLILIFQRFIKSNRNNEKFFENKRANRAYNIPVKNAF